MKHWRRQTKFSSRQKIDNSSDPGVYVRQECLNSDAELSSAFFVYAQIVLPRSLHSYEDCDVIEVGPGDMHF